MTRARLICALGAVLMLVGYALQAFGRPTSGVRWASLLICAAFVVMFVGLRAFRKAHKKLRGRHAE